MIEDDGVDEVAIAPTGESAAALAIALGQTGKLDPRAAAYLEEQTVLARLQIRHFEEERRLAIEAMRRKRYGDRFRNAFLTIAALLAAAVAVLFAAMVIDARNDHGLVIEAFSVPPDIGATGLTGDVVASRFLDRLNALQAATESERPADSYAYNWGKEIKVEIPETGISFGELQDLLREKLGHVTRVTGEVLRTPAGISITARWGGAPPQTFAGQPADFDRLVQQSAEAVYRVSQPFRYAEYLNEHGRVAEAMRAFSNLAAHGDSSDRQWAASQLGFDELNEYGDVRSARENLEKAAASGSIVASYGLINLELWLGHDEKALAHSVTANSLAQVRRPDTTETFFEDNKLIAEGYLAAQTGDFAKSAADLKPLESLTAYASSDVAGAAATANALALNHDSAAATAEIAPYARARDTAFLGIDADEGWLSVPFYWLAANHGDWRAALADMRASDSWLASRTPRHGVYGLMRTAFIVPLEALALAKTGNVAAGKALMAATPVDCYLCTRVRGQLAAMDSDWAAASRAFTDAVRLGPSIPFAYADWGEMLLHKGDYDGAVVKFEQAHAKGPHFADPLEMWGEALMAKNRSDLALAKFEEADKYAPNWGRLHLKWGEALHYAGSKDEAEKQFSIAARLDLSPNDAMALARWRGKRT